MRKLEQVLHAPYADNLVIHSDDESTTFRILEEAQRRFELKGLPVKVSSRENAQCLDKLGWRLEVVEADDGGRRSQIRPKPARA